MVFKHLFPKGECLSTNRVVPSVRVAHFLGLLVMIFNLPTNRDLYLVGGRGVVGVVGRIFLTTEIL